MSNNTKATTFWNFLTENNVEIPIIQRDYAQGRLGKENLRKNFLADLKNALDSDGTMKLDFVYGSIENDNLNPLDGQQRLTTLWLLHWYIALRAGKLTDDNCAIFRKFSYETRISSREFCQHLCIPHNFENFAGNDIVGFITKQTWFYSAWKQDPTIQSMLRMLGGTNLADKNSDDIVDGIEELFQETYVDDFKYYWEKLTPKETIVFYHLPLKDFGLSDDLYIKMNARGKQLTSFENFKADLIGYITKQSEDESLEESEQTKWKELLDPKNGIPIKLDTDWTDIFWKNRSKDSKIDEIYFAFINRYFLQELICAKKEDNTDLYSANDLEEKNGTYKYLYGNKSDDSKLQYSGLDKYLLNDDEAIPLSFFISFRDTLNNYKPNYTCCKFFGGCCLSTCFPAWVDSKIEFIPKYDETGNITTLGQKERVIFLAICRYFEKDSFDETSFKQWMRVVWNIVENSSIETISAMIGAMRLIDELSEGGHNIYNFLSNSQLRIKSNFAKEQVAEEIAKAKQIINGGGEWESKIIDAEKYAFFKGSIRFLFTDDSGNVTEDSWKLFDTKWESSKKYFKEIPEQKNVMNKDFDNANLLKALISHFTSQNYRDVLNWNHKVFNNSVSAWRYYLLNDNIFGAIQELMLGNSSIKKLESSHDEAENRLYQLSQTKLLDFVIKTIPESWIRIYHGHKAIFPSGKGVFLDADTRDRLLTTENLKLKDEDKVPDTNFLYGSNIFFQYNRQFFIYFYDNTVCLMNDNWEGKKLKNQENSDTPENNFYFPVDDEKETEESFLHKLDCLIAQAFPNTDKSVCLECKEKNCESTLEE